MKKLLLLFVLSFATIAVGTQAQAQSLPAGIGVRGGFNFATLNDNDSADSRNGFLLGLYGSYALPGTPLEIQPEVLYNRKGAEGVSLAAATPADAAPVNADVRLDYIQIPVLAKLNLDFITESSLAPHIYAGPAIGFNVNSDFDVNGNGSIPENFDDDINTTQFDVVVGAGAHFKYVDLGVRYDVGLTDVSDNFDGKNGVFSIVASFGL